MDGVVADVLNVGRNACNIGECYKDKAAISDNLKAGDRIKFTYREAKLLGFGDKTKFNDDYTEVEATFTKYNSLFGSGDTIEVDKETVKVDNVDVPNVYTYFYVNRIILGSLIKDSGKTDSIANAEDMMVTILSRVKNVKLGEEVDKDKAEAQISLKRAFLYLDPILKYQTCYDEIFSRIPNKEYKAPFLQMEELSRLTQNLKGQNGELLGISGINTCIKNINVGEVEFFDLSDTSKIDKKIAEIFDKYKEDGFSKEKSAGPYIKKKFPTITSQQYFTFIGVIDTHKFRLYAGNKLASFSPVALLPDGTYTDFSEMTRKIFPSGVISIGKNKDIMIQFQYKMENTLFSAYPDTRQSKHTFTSVEKQLGNKQTMKRMPSLNRLAAPVAPTAPTAPTVEPTVESTVEPTKGGKRRTKKIKKNRK